LTQLIAYPFPASSLNIVTERKAERTQPKKKIPPCINGCLTNELYEAVASYEWPGWLPIDRGHSEVRESKVICDEVSEFLDPFTLNIFFRGNHYNAEVGIEMAKQGQGSKSHVGFSHTNFVS
jgi:hypothetical protein